jgi:hypothetical protein
MPTTEPNPRDLADLSKLADGTLDPAREAEVKARITSSSELSERYERERRAVSLVHAARADRAPARLRARIDAQRPSRASAARRRVAYSGALAAGLAAVVLALVLALPGGAPVSPSVSQAAGLALRGPALAAPAPKPGDPHARLDRDVEEVYFPNWQDRFGWRAMGQRVDTINGRHAVTVYYGWQGHTIAYTIVSAPALKAPVARVNWLHGTELRTLVIDGRLVVTWRRSNHTCVLSGVGVPVHDLQKLATWRM